MKGFKTIAVSAALMIGASGAALAQPLEHGYQNKSWEETHRSANLPAQVYQSSRYGDRDDYGVIGNERRTDRDDVRANAYGRYTNDEWRERGRDNDDAWQYRGAENNRRRVMGPEVRVRQYGNGHVQPRVDADHDRF
jgi:hypothetical protein